MPRQHLSLLSNPQESRRKNNKDDIPRARDKGAGSGRAGRLARSCFQRPETAGGTDETDRDFESRSVGRRIDPRRVRSGAGRRSVCERVRPALLLRQRPGVLRYLPGVLLWLLPGLPPGLLLLWSAGGRRIVQL